MSGPKTLISMRLDPDLLAWVDEFAARRNSNRTAVVEEALSSLREGRLRQLPRHPNPFPADLIIPLIEDPDDAS